MLDLTLQGKHLHIDDCGSDSGISTDCEPFTDFEEEDEDCSSSEDYEEAEEEIEIFYKREMPIQCIAHSSKEGLQIFRRAVQKRYMNSYFKLMEQFHTQGEPWLCGLGTLTHVLNTLEVDPGRLWKLCWRWYDETMIHSCVSLAAQVRVGIEFDDFVCTARSNHLDLEVVRVSPQSSKQHFRKSIRSACQSTDSILVCSYFRETMGQTGTGHYSTIGGYDEERDLILILDVARFKLPPHWVPVDLMWEAMLALDEGSGMPRGYFIMRKEMTQPSVRVVHRDSTLLLMKSRHYCGETALSFVDLRAFFTEMHYWLTSKCKKNRPCMRHDILYSVLDLLNSSAEEINTVPSTTTCVMDPIIVEQAKQTRLYKDVLSYLDTRGAKSLKCASIVRNVVETLCSRSDKRQSSMLQKIHSFRKLKREAQTSKLDLTKSADAAVILSMFLLSITVGKTKKRLNGYAFKSYLKESAEKLLEELITTCKQQVDLVKKLIRHQGHEPDILLDELC